MLERVECSVQSVKRALTRVSSALGAPLNMLRGPALPLRGSRTLALSDLQRGHPFTPHRVGNWLDVASPFHGPNGHSCVLHIFFVALGCARWGGKHQDLVQRPRAPTLAHLPVTKLLLTTPRRSSRVEHRPV